MDGLYGGNCLKGLGEVNAELSTSRFVKAHTQVSFLMASLLILTASLWELTQKSRWAALVIAQVLEMKPMQWVCF